MSYGLELIAPASAVVAFALLSNGAQNDVKRLMWTLALLFSVYIASGVGEQILVADSLSITIMSGLQLLSIALIMLEVALTLIDLALVKPWQRRRS